MQTKLVCDSTGIIENPFVVTVVLNKIITEEPLVPRNNAIKATLQNEYTITKTEEMKALIAPDFLMWRVSALVSKLCMPRIPLFFK